MSAVWILAEARNGGLARISFELATRALALTSEVNAVLISDELSDAELQKLVDCGVSRVVALESPAFKHFNAEPYAAALVEFIEREKPEALIAGADSTGRTLMPYVAVRCHTGLTADCTVLALEPETGLLLQTRPAIGGNIMATIKCAAHRPQMATIRPRSTRPAQPIAGGKGVIERVKVIAAKSRTEVKGFVPAEESAGIQDAECVVVVGRGIKRVEAMPMIEELAELLGAAVGGTREVIDRGFLSYPHQVGLSGKTIMPKLYIGLGVSGAIQHLAGMQTAEHIIAVNRDPEAQIFKVANAGIVGDLFEVVPEMIARLKKGGKI